MTEPITVAIAHFEDLLALGLRAVLADDPSVSIVAQDIAYARIPATLRAHRPSVLILDARALPDLAAVRVLSIEHPATRLVLLGDIASATEAAQLLAFGASACLAPDTQARDVRNAVHLASRGLQLMPIGSKEGDGHVLDPLLTRRESDVLVLLRQGRSNAQIALTLQIGIETVRSHARSIFRKLGVASRRELIGPRPLRG
jgi:DNA-binding NarL/FixJ family response regulator